MNTLNLQDRFDRVAVLKDAKSVVRFCSFNTSGTTLLLGTWQDEQTSFASIFVYNVQDNFNLLQTLSLHTDNCRSMCFYTHPSTLEKIKEGRQKKHEKEYSHYEQEEEEQEKQGEAEEEETEGENLEEAEENRFISTSNAGEVFFWKRTLTAIVKQQKKLKLKIKDLSREENYRWTLDTGDEKSLAAEEESTLYSNKKDAFRHKDFQMRFPRQVGSVIVDEEKGFFIVPCNNGCLYKCDLEKREVLKCIDAHEITWINMVAWQWKNDHNNNNQIMGYKKKSKYFGSVGLDSCLRMYHAETMTQVGKVKLLTGSGLWCLTFNGNGSEVAVGSNAGHVYVLKVLVGSKIEDSLEQVEKEIEIENFATRPEDNKIVLPLKWTFSTHRQIVNWVTFSLDSQILFTASRDKKVRCWSTSHGKSIGDAGLAGGITGGNDWLTSCCPDPAHRFFVTGSGAGQAWIFRNHFSDLKFASRLVIWQIKEKARDGVKMKSVFELWNVVVSVQRFLPYLFDLLDGGVVSAVSDEEQKAREKYGRK